jgi:hypothetical protein
VKWENGSPGQGCPNPCTFQMGHSPFRLSRWEVSEVLEGHLDNGTSAQAQWRGEGRFPPSLDSKGHWPSPIHQRPALAAA